MVARSFIVHIEVQTFDQEEWSASEKGTQKEATFLLISLIIS